MPMTDDQLRDTMNARMSPSARLLGMNILEVDSKAGRVLMTFEPRPEFCNPMGSVQGGFVTAMLDDAAAYAAIIHSGERIAVPTIELKVSFFGPFYGDYWVLDHADDYSWAIVGEPSGRYLWLLSRAAKPGQARLDQLIARARALGYDTSMLRITQQP